MAKTSEEHAPASTTKSPPKASRKGAVKDLKVKPAKRGTVRGGTTGGTKGWKNDDDAPKQAVTFNYGQ